MNSIFCRQSGSRGPLHFLPLLLFLLSGQFAPANAQNVDSLVQVICHSPSVEAISQAKSQLPKDVAKIDMKLLDRIVQMRAPRVTQSDTSRSSGSEYISSSLLQVDRNGNIRVEAYLGDITASSIDQLRSAGAEVKSIDDHFRRVTCVVPAESIESLARIKNVLSLAPALKPFVRVGAYTSAGDGILKADVMRSTFNVNGLNIKVGVISDGVDHWTNSRDQGDLPANLTVLHNDYHSEDPEGGYYDEGTAMSEIVYDLAPGSSLYFNDAGQDVDECAAHIDGLKVAGCNVIVDDVIYPDEPVFEDGTIGQHVDQATAQGVRYISACGNSGTSTWDAGMFVDANHNGWMEFNGSDETNAITLYQGLPVGIVLQWANKWGNSSDDFDLFVFENDWQESPWLDASVEPQTGAGSRPFEYITLTRLAPGAGTLHLRVRITSGNIYRELKLIVLGTADLEYVTEGGIYGHAAASSCISVGAINASSPNTIASYSSHGPSRIYSYNASGAPTSYVDRATPSICGIDGVQTYVGMSGLWEGHPAGTLFYGTSAAAPHVAAISALLLQLNSSLNWQQTKDILTATATKVSGMGGQNFTNAYGFGRVDAYQSGLLALAYASKSQSSQSTAYNGQRKLFRETSGKLHEVFASGTITQGEIFYRNSTNGGVSWSNAVRLSDGTATSLAPCITMSSSTTNVIVTWQQTNGSNYNVVFRRSTNGGTAWGSITTLQSNFSCGSPGPLPSVSGNTQTGRVVVVYRSSSGLRYVASSNNMTSWTASAGVPGSTSGNHNSPSTAYYANDVNNCNLAFATDVSGYSSVISYSSYTGSWSPLTNLSSVIPSSYQQQRNPSVATTTSIAPPLCHVAWEALLIPANAGAYPPQRHLRQLRQPVFGHQLPAGDESIDCGAWRRQCLDGLPEHADGEGGQGALQLFRPPVGLGHAVRWPSRQLRPDLCRLIHGPVSVYLRHGKSLYGGIRE